MQSLRFVSAFTLAFMWSSVVLGDEGPFGDQYYSSVEGCAELSINDGNDPGALEEFTFELWSRNGLEMNEAGCSFIEINEVTLNYSDDVQAWTITAFCEDLRTQDPGITVYPDTIAIRRLSSTELVIGRASMQSNRVGDALERPVDVIRACGVTVTE